MRDPSLSQQDGEAGANAPPEGKTKMTTTKTLTALCLLPIILKIAALAAAVEELRRDATGTISALRFKMARRISEKVQAILEAEIAIQKMKRDDLGFIRVGSTPTDIKRAFFSRRISDVQDERLDPFQQAKRLVERELLTPTDKETVEWSRSLHDDDKSTAAKKNNHTFLMRATAPLALDVATKLAKKCASFEEAWSFSLAALGELTARWDPAKGLRLSSFIMACLPLEAEKERQEAVLGDAQDWKAASVESVINRILDGEFNQPWTTWYSDCQLSQAKIFCSEGENPETLTGWEYPENATVTYDSEGRIVNGLPMMTTVKRTVPVRGKMVTKEVKEPVFNPMPLVSRFMATKSSRKAFTSKGLNKPRTWKRAKTGIQASVIEAAGKEFAQNLATYPKLSARDMTAARAKAPLRPLRREEITPRMVQSGMRQYRSDTQGFDERKWSLFAIASIMERLGKVSSYDVVITNDEGDETRKSDFLEAPEAEEVHPYDLAKEIILAIFVDEELDPAAQVSSLLSRNDLDSTTVEALSIVLAATPRITFAKLEAEDSPAYDAETISATSPLVAELKASGLYELALEIPVQKFLKAKGTAFFTLCSKYGVRVKHARLLVDMVTAHQAAIITTVSDSRADAWA